MDNLSIDTSGLSEQLGIYDFFNVILSGTTFVCGVCLVCKDLYEYIFDDLTLSKGLFLILLIYILGMILQDLGSTLDKKYFNIYSGMNQRILQGNTKGRCGKESAEQIVSNPLVLKQYRKDADKLLIRISGKRDKKRFDDNDVNAYFFSVCQYYVSACGKDKKVEKLRALFAMSKTLMACFFSLSVVALLATFIDSEVSISICNLVGISALECANCRDKIFLSIIFFITAYFFVSRAKRTMKNFLLILLGTYHALAESKEESKVKSQGAYRVKPRRVKSEVISYSCLRRNRRF